jgi:site-specific DNA-methyltransferase (adenine-specific)
LYCGDCLIELGNLEPNSIDTVITDPPAGISFMGSTWDSHSHYEPQTDKAKLAQEFGNALGLAAWESGFLSFTVDWALSTIRPHKPGGTALVWAIPRTSDLTSLGLRLAGYEVKDVVTHIFGSGFPKSADIGKHLDRLEYKKREDAIKNALAEKGFTDVVWSSDRE